MHNAEMKWLFNVLTDRSEVLCQCMCGVTNCNCMSFSSKYCFRSYDTFFSMMFSFSVNPLFLNLSWIFVIPFIMQGPVLFLSG